MVEGLIETALAAIDRFVVDKALMEGESQPFPMATYCRGDGLPIVGVSVQSLLPVSAVLNPAESPLDPFHAFAAR
jgi:hypothetical protein